MSTRSEAVFKGATKVMLFVYLIAKGRFSSLILYKLFIMIRRLSLKSVTLLIAWGVFIITSSFTTNSSPANDNDKRVFYIARSKNANIVCYDFNLDAKGVLVEKEPLKVYWINQTDHPGERSGLSYIQNKMAYGYSFRYMGKGSYEISLVAFPSRKLWVEKKPTGKGYRGRMIINGRESVLNKIYVQAKPESFLKVAWVELTGTDIESGKVMTERIIPQ